MKAVIFLIFMVLVISGMIWSMRKSRAEADLARRQSIKQKQKQRQEAIKPLENATWPTIIRPLKSGADGDPDHLEEEPELEVPSMTTIEYEPPDRVTV